MNPQEIAAALNRPCCRFCRDRFAARSEEDRILNGCECNCHEPARQAAEVVVNLKGKPR